MQLRRGRQPGRAQKAIAAKIPGMTLHDWNAIAEEPLAPRMWRRMIHSGGITVARMRLERGAVVPEHKHHNEQISMVESGSLKFNIAGREQLVRAGETLMIAPHEPHSVQVLEDTTVIDIFTPRREDWIAGEDAYLRG